MHGIDTFILLLPLEHAAKVGRQDTSQASCPNHISQNGCRVFVGLGVCSQLIGIEASINDGIGPLPRQLCQSLGELGDVFTDALLWVLYLLVHIGQLVVRLQSTDSMSKVYGQALRVACTIIGINGGMSRPVLMLGPAFQDHWMRDELLIVNSWYMHTKL